MAKSKPSKPVALKNGKNPASLSPFDVLTLQEVAAYLRLPEDAVQAEAEAGRLIGQNICGEWRFVRAGIVAWLQTPRGFTPKASSSATTVTETPEEFEALMANIRAYRDEVDRETGSGKYAQG